jgi:hypothetical protein
MKNRLSLPNVPCKYGAPMGRRNQFPNDLKASIKLQMEQLRFVDGDYDKGGAYWGGNSNIPKWIKGVGYSIPEPEYIFCAFGEDEQNQVRIFVRAKNRKDAKSLVRDILPFARFYR